MAVATRDLENKLYQEKVEDVVPRLPNGKIDFYSLKPSEAAKLVGSMSEKRYHGQSFVNYVYKHKETDILKMMSISEKNRSELLDKVEVTPLPILKKSVSIDGTVKFLFQVESQRRGIQEIESVYIPEEERVTLCVSSQVGCKMGCKFCLTAQLGFLDNLTAGDIVRQVMSVNADPELRPVTNIVFMGMGEPLDNIEQVRKAISILTDPKALEISHRRITVSTVGMVDKIDQLRKEDPFRLAVSLNGTTDDVRSSLMPINRRWNIQELISACQRYAQRTNKKVTFEYILMKGLTDRPEDIRELVKICSQLPAKVNLIPYNESSFTDFKRPSETSIYDFHARLLKSKIPVFIRKNRGNDIFAACGMLRKESSGPSS